MPHLVRVQVGRAGRRPLRLWIPVLPLVVVLSPLLLLALAAGLVACWHWQVPPVRALVRTGRLLRALKGTELEIDQPDVRMLLHVR